jgi:hypothetical protein
MFHQGVGVRPKVRNVVPAAFGGNSRTGRARRTNVASPKEDDIIVVVHQADSSVLLFVVLPTDTTLVVSCAVVLKYFGIHIVLLLRV